MKKVIFFLFFATSFLFSQEKLIYQSDVELQKKIDSLDKLDKKQEILELLVLVKESDSLIDYVNIKKSYYNLQLKNFNKTIEICDKAIVNANDFNAPALYVNKAVAYFSLGEINKAIETYTNALKQFPMSSSLYRRRGEMYSENKEFKKAYQDFKKAIEINPYDVQTHLSLGDLFYFENRFTQALMIYNTYLLLLPDGESSFDILNHLDAKYASKSTSIPKGISLTEDDDAFEELDLLIENRISLSKKYKIKNKIDLSFVRQNHLLFSKLKEVVVKDEFFKKYYHNIYLWMVENDRFNDFVYMTCFSVKNEKYAKIIKKKEKEIIAFYGLVSNKYGEFADEKEVMFDGKNQNVHYSYDDSNLVGVGLKKNNKYNGIWEFYNISGRLTARGAFNKNEQREGEWLWFDKKGDVNEKAFYKDGLLEGDYTTFYENGNKKIECNYKQDKLDGNYKWYSRSGALEEEKNFKEGELDGVYKNYYEVGSLLPKYNLTYKAGKAEGEITQLFESGNLYYKANYVEDNLEGPVQYFYNNKQIAKEYKTVADKIEGNFKEFYNNGQLYQEGEYVGGALTGLWKLNFIDGKTYKHINYTENELNGLYQEYGHLGHQFLEYEYKKGKLYRATFYDKDKKVLFNEKKERNKMNFIGYGSLGNKSTEGLYNVKGGKQGVWKYYNKNGVLTSVENYNKEGELHGESVNYYMNGEVKSRETYVNDVLDGYIVNYYPNGNMASQYYYKDSKQDKEAHYYYEDGTIKAGIYYHKGDLHGLQSYYDAAGRLDYTYIYEFGYLEEEVNYGLTKNDVLERIDYDKLSGKKTITRNFYDGSVKSKTSHINGILHGEAIYYHPNGKVFSKGMFRNGQYHGSWKWFYSDGTIHREENYISGTLHGEAKKYHETGKLSTVKTYVLGDVHEQYKFYAEDGVTVTTDIKCYMGDKQGETRLYSDKGDLQLIRYYDMNVLIGYSYLGKDGKLLKMIPIENETAKIVAYYANGKKSREFEVKNSEFINNYIEYYPNGKVESKTFYKNDQSSGEEVEYYSNGNKKIVYNYLLGELHGVQKEYYSNGKLKQEYTYKNGTKIGEYVKYSDQGKILEKGNCVGGFEFQEK